MGGGGVLFPDWDSKVIALIISQASIFLPLQNGIKIDTSCKKSMIISLLLLIGMSEGF